MTESDRDRELCRSLWDFSLTIYANDRFREASLKLQEGNNADVNILLFVIWFSQITGTALKSSDILSIQQASYLPRRWVKQYRKFRKNFYDEVICSARSSENNKEHIKEDSREQSKECESKTFVKRYFKVDRKSLKQSLLNSELLLEAEVQRSILGFATQSFNLAKCKHHSSDDLSTLLAQNLDRYLMSCVEEQSLDTDSIEILVDVALENFKP